MISAATRTSGDQLSEAGQDYPANIRQEYLQLPENLPERVRRLAVRVAGSGDPFNQALRVQQYLRETYPYDLNTPPPAPERDVVDSFLFDQQQGFCSHYASAMAVMLRVQGIPTRVVTGYATGSYDTTRGAYRVTEDAVHAWVEVYFPGIGWVEFEPTAARAVFVYPQSSPQVAMGQPVPELDPVKENQLAEAATAVLVGLGMLALLAAPFVLLRTFSVRRAMPTAQQASQLYRQMRQAFVWAGFGAAPSVTPEEYVQQHSGRIAPYALLFKALRQATALYQQAIYSNHTPEQAHVRSTTELWRSSFSQWLKLWFKTHWNKKP